MAFFGIRWIPTHETELKVSEADPVSLSDVTRKIRADGRSISAEEYKLKEYEYGAAYAVYQQQQTMYVQQQHIITEHMRNTNERERKGIEIAGKYRMEGNSKYYEVIKTLSSMNQQFVENQYLSFLTLKTEMEEAEHQLWISHAALTNTQSLYDLWNFETTIAEKDVNEIKKKMNIELTHRKYKIVGNEDRLAEIRLKNKEKLQERRKQKRQKKEAASTDQKGGLAAGLAGLLEALPGAAPKAATSTAGGGGGGSSKTEEDGVSSPTMNASRATNTTSSNSRKGKSKKEGKEKYFPGEVFL